MGEVADDRRDCFKELYPLCGAGDPPIGEAGIVYNGRDKFILQYFESVYKVVMILYQPSSLNVAGVSIG